LILIQETISDRLTKYLLTEPLQIQPSLYFFCHAFNVAYD